MCRSRPCPTSMSDDRRPNNPPRCSYRAGQVSVAEDQQTSSARASAAERHAGRAPGESDEGRASRYNAEVQPARRRARQQRCGVGSTPREPARPAGSSARRTSQQRLSGLPHRNKGGHEAGRKRQRRLTLRSTIRLNGVRSRPVRCSVPAAVRRGLPACVGRGGRRATPSPPHRNERARGVHRDAWALQEVGSSPAPARRRARRTTNAAASSSRQPERHGRASEGAPEAGGIAEAPAGASVARQVAVDSVNSRRLGSSGNAVTACRTWSDGRPVFAPGAQEARRVQQVPAGRAGRPASSGKQSPGGLTVQWNGQACSSTVSTV